MKMYQRIEVDAVSSNFEYKSALLAVYNQLRSSELQAMKFLCSDFISSAKLEKIRTVLDLFQELEKLQKIGEPDNVSLLGELLYYIGRSDQLKALRLQKETVIKTIAESPILDSYRIMLFKISEQLSIAETKDLLFLHGALLPRSKRETIEKPEELFQALERQCILLRQDPRNIIKMMEAIGRSDLVQMVQIYIAKEQKPKGSVMTEFVSQHQNDFDQQTPSIAQESGHCFEESIFVLPRRKKDNPSFLYTRQNNHPAGKDSSALQPTQRIAEPENIFVGRGFVKRPTNLTEHNEFQPLSEEQSCEDNNAVGQRLSVNLREDDSFELPCYPMSQKPRGLCLIINNETFFKNSDEPSGRKMPNREGTQKDAKLLEELFQQKLKFSVIVKPNLTAEEISKTMADMAFKVDHSKFDCFVCCILSHGILGSIYGVNGRTVEIKDLTNFFKGASCPTLRGKPKIFFIQACQGKDKQPGFPVATDGPSSVTEPGETEANDQVETIPNEADFLLGYATVPGYVSFRSKSQGSWYINTLVQMMHKYVDRYDLLSILIKVNEEVSRAIASMQDGTYKQSPMPMATLRKRIFFR